MPIIKGFKESWTDLFGELQGIKTVKCCVFFFSLGVLLMYFYSSYQTKTIINYYEGSGLREVRDPVTGFQYDSINVSIEYNTSTDNVMVNTHPEHKSIKEQVMDLNNI